MKNKEKWKPSKFVHKNGKLIASRDPKEVGIGSRLGADMVAACYAANLKRYAKGRLLDLGCGKVPFYEAYKNYITENICVDWNNTFHKNEYLDFECDLTKDLIFREGEFDTILLSDVLEHIPEPMHLWHEMYRVLAKNGRLILNVPFFYWLHEAPYDYYRYTEYALRRFVELSGFKLILLEPGGGVPEIITDILVKNILSYFPKLGRPAALILQQITSVFIKTRVGRKMSMRTAKQFPMGYFLIAEK